jgi:hypothetical protein
LANTVQAIEAVLKRHEQLVSDAKAADPHSLTDYDARELAAIWRQLRFNADTVERWLAARCYNPLAAKDLREAGITPEQAATTTNAGTGKPDTIAFKLSSSQLILTEALQQLDGNPEGLSRPVLHTGARRPGERADDHA